MQMPRPTLRDPDLTSLWRGPGMGKFLVKAENTGQRHL